MKEETHKDKFVSYLKYVGEQYIKTGNYLSYLMETFSNENIDFDESNSKEFIDNIEKYAQILSKSLEDIESISAVLNKLIRDRKYVTIDTRINKILQK